MTKKLGNLTSGPLLIMLAASLWAIDALFRTQLTFEIPPASIVFIEHTLGFIFLMPIFLRSTQSYRNLSKKDWGVLILLTILSSAIGTLLFTEALSRSFAEFDFVTPILLQKLQPIFVILLSAIFLKEKINLRFIGLGILALIGSYMISFGTEAVNLNFTGKEQIVLLAIGAAFAWGTGTILSKSILKKLSFREATAMRFFLAIPITYILSLLLNQTYSFTNLEFYHIWRFIVIAVATGGAGAILIYYKGLKTTEAKISTIAELMFPIVSIIIAITTLNPYGDPQKLTLANTFGIVILLISILMISFNSRKK